MNFFRRIPLLPTLLTVLVVVASAAPATPIFDAATRGEVIDAFLQRPLAYVVLAPLSDVLDTLTLLSSNQHIAILVGAFVLFVAVRVFKRDATIKAHAIATLTFFAGIVALYAAAMLLP